MALKPLNDQNFSAEVREKTDTSVLVKFHAPGCKPCAAMDTVLQELAPSFDRVDFTSCNVQEAPVTASELGIRSVPTLVLFTDGMVRDVITGTRSKADLRHWIQENV